MPLIQTLSALFAYCTQAIVQVKNAMTGASSEWPQLHRYFRPAEDRPAAMTICAVIDEYVAEGEHSGSMMVDELVLYKELDDPQHEYLWAKVTSDAPKFVGYAILERGRGKLVMPVADDKKLLLTPSSMQRDSPDGSAASGFDLALETIQSPSSTPPDSSSPNAIAPLARRGPGFVGYSISLSSPSLKPHHADDNITLSRSKPKLLKDRPASHPLRRWLSASPNARSIKFSQLLAACSITSSESPMYDVMRTQCFYFAGVILELVTNGEGIQEDSSSAGKYHGFPVGTTNVSSAAKKLRESFLKKAAEIEEARAEQVHKQRTELEVALAAAKKDAESTRKANEGLETEIEELRAKLACQVST